MDADAPAQPPHLPSTRAAAVATAALWLLAVAVPVALERISVAGRAVVDGPMVIGSRPALLEADGRAVLAEWTRLGVTGRTVVHVGAFLHSIPPPGSDLSSAPLRATPGMGAPLREALRGAATDRSYLWAAVELGIARRIVFVEPRKALLARASDLDRPPPAPGAPLDLGVRGLDREAYDRVPPLPEPVLLDVAASWFEEGDPDALWAQLRASGLRADVVTLNRLGGSDDVSDGARARLTSFAERLARPDATGGSR